MPDPDQIDDLVARPVEGLNIEVKRWISPAQPQGIAKIIKGAFAIYNRNGGYFLVGFDDVTGQPDAANAPADVRVEFHVDMIQTLISRYASKPFEIRVEFRERDGGYHPIIVIPSGVTTVVAVKRDLQDGNLHLLREGDIYFRTLAANGVVSSARARPEDWTDILSVCFDNREADIARFIRRHLAGDLGGLRGFLRDERAAPQPEPTRSGPPTMAFDGVVPTVPTRDLWSVKKRLAEETAKLLADGKERFESVIAKRTELAEVDVLKYGRWNVALVIDPPREVAPPTKEFLAKLEAANPSLTGWPVWLVSTRFTDPKSRPIVTEGAWQTLIVSLDSWSGHLEFQRVSSDGSFFLSRVLQDDLQDRQTGGPGRVLDPILVILRVAEAIVVGLSFAKALGWSSEGTKLGFEFEWTGLSGRVLKTWANPMTILPPWFSSAHDSTVSTFVEVPLDTSPAAIAPYVQRGVASLFAAFDGATIATPIIEEWVRRLVERKL